MWSYLRRILIGPPLPTYQAINERLNKVRALAAFSPDALSSIAYANEEIFLGLMVAGAAGLSLSWPIALAIGALLAVVALSYYQTIHGYPSGGGSYIVARANLSITPGLIAAAALLIDYVLTAAVSLTAGLAAIASAFPVLWPYRVVLSLVLLAAIMVLNLRGLRETGTLLSIPVYLFLFTYLPMLGIGLVRAVMEGPGSLASVAPPATQPLTAFLVLRTFAAGCTALTGVEAISNGVPAFRPPEAQNAGRTLIVMAVLMGMLFVGSIGLTQYLGVVAGPQETILSALARRVLGNSPAYLVIQMATLLILAVAANTSFADFPRVVSLLARDGFLPRQFTNLGDRLVFANGILLLAGLTGLLIVVFEGDTHLLIPLFAVGVFLAFTLSQVGMVVHWARERGRAWWLHAAFNLAGGVTTAITLVIVLAGKFVEGAWIIVLLIPLFVSAFWVVRRHYDQTARELSLRGPAVPSLLPMPRPRVVVPISGVTRASVEAVRYARSISDDVTAVCVDTDEKNTQRVCEAWAVWGQGVPLVVVPSPYRSIVGPLLDFLDSTDREQNDGRLAAVILPEFVPARWWQHLLHNQTAWAIKTAILYRRQVFGGERIIIDVPYHLRQ